MTLSQIVVTRETAEKLKSAGYETETALVWVKIGSEAWRVMDGAHLAAFPKNATIFFAPTAGELMEEMPDWLSVYRVMDGTGWAACHIGEDVYELAPTPADALAMLWIELNRKDKP
jgi:hypothetical protein